MTWRKKQNSKEDKPKSKWKGKGKTYELDGHKFSSKEELNWYIDLSMRQRKGEIKDLSLKPKFKLIVNGHLIGTYTSDFKYLVANDDKYTIHEHKGGSASNKKNQLVSRDYILRKKLFLALYPEYNFIETFSRP